jgi:hypothetical protein
MNYKLKSRKHRRRHDVLVDLANPWKVLRRDAHRLPLLGAVASVIFEPAAGGVERIADRDMRILMRVVRTAVAADDYLGPRDGEIDADREQLVLPMPLVRAFDDDMARRDPIEKLVELFRPLAYSRLERGGWIHVAKGDLECQLHRMSPADNRLSLGCGAATAIDPTQFRRQRGRDQG